jgi:hypothetical protein
VLKSFVVETNNLRTVADSVDNRESLELQLWTMQVDRSWANEIHGCFLAWCDVSDSCSKLDVSLTRQVVLLTGVAWTWDEAQWHHKVASHQRD